MQLTKSCYTASVDDHSGQGTQATTHYRRLIQDAREDFSAAGFSNDGYYLKPRRRSTLDLIVSPKCLDRTLGFAEELFGHLTLSGNRVMIAAPFENFIRAPIGTRLGEPISDNKFDRQLWAPWYPTVCYFGAVALGLSFVEISDRIPVVYSGNGEFVPQAQNPSVRDGRLSALFPVLPKQLPLDRLKLVSYSPIYAVPQTREWLGSNGGLAKKDARSIAEDLESEAKRLGEKLYPGG
ncbi:hypothetical protein [Rhizobium tumorigenes]|uniref:hypothetical protein n=1 Tax=Rhizobium tumorigenes TaxID=2041385 RepID=UPI00241DE4C9|nr:hypothetical protein [Rhizobium tumorigenes]WFR99556.1 hypothetical protein PR016_10275 [Rhizobium tumorigenes]